MSVVNTVAGDNDSSDTPQAPADNGSVRSDLANTMLINPSDSAQHEASHPMSHVTVPVAPALHDHAAQANAADDDNAGTNDEAQAPAVDIPADPNTPSPEAPEAPAASAAEVMEAIDGHIIIRLHSRAERPEYSGIHSARLFSYASTVADSRYQARRTITSIRSRRVEQRSI